MRQGESINKGTKRVLYRQEIKKKTILSDNDTKRNKRYMDLSNNFVTEV